MRTIAFCLAVVLSVPAALAQTEQSRMLEVRRKQVELQALRSEQARKQELFQQGLISGAELEGVKTRVTGAELNYQEAVLSLLSIEPRVSVRRAVKTQAEDGRRLLQLTLVNLTSALDDSQFRMLSNFDGAAPLPKGLEKRALRDLFVSIRDTGSADVTGRTTGRGIAVGLPYELHLPELRHGQERTLTFQLLRDVDSALVTITTKNQTQELELQLEQSGSGGDVEISSMQISQEADVGGQATYDLHLERSSVDVRGFQLTAEGLPREISYSFLDAQGEARLSQIHFPAGVRQQTLRLRLFLPEALPVDRPIAFHVVAAGGAGAGRLRLELTPRGVGRIELAAESLFAEADPGKAIETTMKLRNSGTRRLDNTQIAIEAPMNWSVELTPRTIASLEPHRDEDVRMRVTVPADAAVGDYEIRIRTRSSAFDRQVPSEEKIFRVSVKPRSKLWVAGGVFGSLLAAATAIVLFGIKLARR